MVFTLRSGIDFLFQPLKVEDSDQVHVMIVGASDGRLHLSIYDSFVIGAFKYSPLDPLPHASIYRLVHHASHPDVSTHSIFLRSNGDGDDSLSLVPLDLPFIPSSPINLTLLASKLTTLQKLLRYLKQTQLHMLVEFKNARELPKRFLAGIQEDLAKAEQGPQTIIQALYHTVATGHTYEPVREWLVESLAERVSCSPVSDHSVAVVEIPLLTANFPGPQTMGQGRCLSPRESPQPRPRELPPRLSSDDRHPLAASRACPLLRSPRRHRLLSPTTNTCP
jgi:hypothetical protein